MANRILDHPPPEMHPAPESTCRVPYEIVEMIIAHLARHTRTLKACSLTCRSWHTTTLPYLRRTITLRRNTPDATRSQLKPLSKLHELGQIPLVKEIRVRQPRGTDSSGWFGPRAFTRRDLCHFSAFANVQTLRLEELEIHRFIPGIERYFEHFSPTLRSITLFNPHCTPRQLSHFLSLFSKLDNIKIWQIDTQVPNTAIPDTTPVPSSAPKLRGRFALYQFYCVETWTHLIASCNGIKFRYMNLRDVPSCAPVLLEACAETLETLRFNATDGSVSKWFYADLPADLG